MKYKKRMLRENNYFQRNILFLHFVFIDRFYSVFVILSYKYPLEREPHASLLVELGFQPLAIAERLGHEKIETTLNTYSHLYPNKQAELAERLELEKTWEGLI